MPSSTRAIVTSITADANHEGSKSFDLMFGVTYIRDGGGQMETVIYLRIEDWVLATANSIMAQLRDAIIIDAEAHGYTLLKEDILGPSLNKGLA